MTRTTVFFRAVLLALVIGMTLFNSKIDRLAAASDNRNYPAFVTISMAGTEVTPIRHDDLSSLAPASNNNTAFRLLIQMTRNISEQPPSDIRALRLAGVPTVVKVGPSIDFAGSCVLLEDDTLALCSISPPATSNWGTPGPLIMRIAVTSSDGYKSETLHTGASINQGPSPGYY